MNLYFWFKFGGPLCCGWLEFVIQMGAILYSAELGMKINGNFIAVSVDAEVVLVIVIVRILPEIDWSNTGAYEHRHQILIKTPAR